MTTNNDNSTTFDPQQWANKTNGEKKNFPSPSSYQPTSNGEDTTQKVLDVARRITERGIDITHGYDNWLRLGFALADGLGEEGRAVYHELSRQNTSYSIEECDRQFSNCLSSHGKGVTIATFFKMAQDAGVEVLNTFNRENQKISKSLCHDVTLCHPYKNNDNYNNSLIINNSIMHDNGCHSGTSCHKGYKQNNIPTNGTIYCNNTFSGQIFRSDWCDVLRPILDSVSDEECADKMLLASIAIISGLLSNIYGRYGGHVVYPPLYIIFHGPAASRKGELKACTLIMKPLKTEMRRGYEAELADYRRRHSEWENMGGRSKKREERGEEPKQPRYRSLVIPANSSASAAYMLLEASGGAGIMFETEADVVSQSLISDYGDYSTGLRAAYHHEPIQMNRVKDSLHIEIEEPRLAVCLTCTPGQLPHLFPSFENGLGSRFLFYGLTRRVEWLSPFAVQTTSIDDVMTTLGTEMQELVHIMRELGNKRVEFVLSNEQQKEFNHFFSDLLSEQFGMLGDGITSFIFRMGLSAFRIAMVLSLLRKYSDRPFGLPMFDNGEQALQCTDTDFRITMTIMNTLINHTAAVYSSLVDESKEDMPASVEELSIKEKDIYKKLEDAFIRQDVIDLAANLGLSTRSAHRCIRHFIDKHVAIRVENGKYEKIKREDKNEE